MKFKRYRPFILLLGLALLGGAAASPTDAANPHSSWAWAKPLNQKPGSLLYTTNVAAKTQSVRRSSSGYQRSYSTHQSYQTPSRGPSLRLFRRFRR